MDESLGKISAGADVRQESPGIYSVRNLRGGFHPLFVELGECVLAIDAPAGYRLLGLQRFYTAGPKEVRAWTVPLGATALQAAGRIHSDFERGFIRAEVADYEDFVGCGGEQGAKEAGKLRLEGKEYRIQDGDVVHFRFNV